MIDATIDANDRTRERRFAKGLPCLLTGLTKKQWEYKKWFESRAHLEEGLEIGAGTAEYDEGTELGGEASDAMDRLSWSRPKS